MSVALLAPVAWAKAAPGSYQRFNELTGGAVSTNGVIGLVGLAISLITLLRRPTAAGSEEEQLSASVERVAEALTWQWSGQARELQLDSLHPLRVSWCTTDGKVAGELADVLGVSAAEVGLFRAEADRQPAPTSDWDGVVDVVEGLLGSGARSPAGGRRLLVVGPAGSGKTVLAQHVARQVNERWRHGAGGQAGPGAGRGRPERGPARVLVPLSVAGWDPGTEGAEPAALLTWIAKQLVEQHPYLASAAMAPGLPSGSDIRSSVAYRLLEKGRVVPILDGLDEVPTPLRAEAIAKIDGLIPANVSVIVTTRGEEYWEATRWPREEDGPPTGVLRWAAVAHLLPLGHTDIAEYLRDRIQVVNQAELSRRARVLTELAEHEAGPLAKALSSPLMAWLAAYVYVEAGRADPRELPTLAAEHTLERHLLGSFAPVAFRRSRWGGEQRVVGWLAFLAQDLRARGLQRLSWWTLGDSHRLAVGIVVGLAAGLATGLAVGLTLGFALGNGLRLGPTIGLFAGVLAGNLFGLGIGIGCGARTLPPTNLEFQIRRRLLEAVLGGLVVGGLAGLLFGVFFGIDDGVLVGILIGTPIAVGYGAFGQARDTASPAALLKRDRLFVVTFVLAYGIPCGFVASRYFGGPLVGVLTGIVTGISGGAVNGVQYALVKRWDQFGAVAWFRLVVVRAYFATRRDLPWRLMAFLKDAHQRGVLRQDGGYYQFRHMQLRDELADRVGDPRRDSRR